MLGIWGRGLGLEQGRVFVVGSLDGDHEAGIFAGEWEVCDASDCAIVQRVLRQRYSVRRDDAIADGSGVFHLLLPYSCQALGAQHVELTRSDLIRVGARHRTGHGG